MGLDAGTIIRIGSAMLFVLLGIGIVLAARSNRGARWLAAFMALYGTEAVIANLTVGSTSLLKISVVGGLLAAAGLACVGVALGMPRRMTSRELPIVVLAAAVALTGLGGFFVHGPGLHAMAASFTSTAVFAGGGVPDGILIGLLMVAIVGTLTMVVALPLRAAVAQVPTRRDLQQWFALSGFVGPFFVFYLVIGFTDVGNIFALFSNVLLIGSLAAAWLVVAARTGQRRAVVYALLWPLLGLAGYLYMLLPANQANVFHDAYGMLGVARLIGWTLLIYSILRQDLLGVPLPHIAMSRGVVAASSLAVLFIVAQVAQNFFAAQYGLLMGGVVAGTLLFAANPIQKGIERLGKREGPAATATNGNEASFREAVELAYKDRRFEPKEELALARLATRLGVSAERATEIRHAVERSSR